MPPVLLFPRITSRPVELAGMRLETGVRMAYGPALTHRLPEVFPDPLAFDPERFLGAGPRPGGFLSFGGGARRCPGEQFALNEVLLILACWLRRRFPRIEDGAVIRCRGLVAHTPSRPVSFRNVDRKDWDGKPARVAGKPLAGIKAPGCPPAGRP